MGEILTKSKPFQTKYREEQERRELAIVQEYNQLAGIPGAMRAPIEDHLMVKYNIHSRSTIWVYRQRVEKRQKQER